MNEDEVPLFDELGEGVDPRDLDMSQALSGSTTGLPGKKRGVRGEGGREGGREGRGEGGTE